MVIQVGCVFLFLVPLAPKKNIQNQGLNPHVFLKKKNETLEVVEVAWLSFGIFVHEKFGASNWRINLWYIFSDP